MQIIRFALGVIGTAVALLLAGCDHGGGGGLGTDVGSNDPNVVAAVGDSITAGSYPAQLAGMIHKTVNNHGVGGATADDGAARIGGVLAEDKPGYVLILYGANDAITSVDPDDTIAALSAIIGACKANKSIPVIATLTPMYTEHSIYDGNAKRISERIRTLASQTGITLCDLEKEFGDNETLFQSDGLHPNSQGDMVIADSFAALF